MSTLLEPAAAGADTLVDDSEYEHETDAAAWLTVNVWPATVSVPARGVGSVLAATENCTVPLPVPDAPAVIDSHGTLAVADHAQPAPVVTSTEPVRARRADGLRGGRQRVRARYRRGSLVDRERLAGHRQRARARRRVGVGGHGELHRAVAGPRCAGGDRQPRTLAVADHAQPVPVVTFTEPVVLDAPTDCEVADSEYVHGVDDTPDWLTVNVWPAIVAVPVRAAEDPFAATLISTVPSPAPLAPAVIVSHGAWLVAVHCAPAARQHGQRDRASRGADRLARRRQGERALRNRCAGRRLRERVDLAGDRHRARTLEAGVRRDVDRDGAVAGA